MTRWRRKSSSAQVCTLTEAGSGKKFDTQTDSYGDFWFEDLKEGKFDLQIRMGARKESFAGLDTTGKDINLGDIPLT